MGWVASFMLAVLPVVFAQNTPTARTPIVVNKAQPAPKIEGRFEFEVIESYDAKYLGDTPGHIGRHGELGDSRPQAALGDPVYRGDKKVGTVTNLKWSKGHGSLEIEFDPEPLTRVSLGDVVWLKLGDTKTEK